MCDIVVHSPDFRNWHACVRYAAQLAASMHGSLTGLYVSPRSEPSPGPPLLADEVHAYAQDEIQCAIRADLDFAAWAVRMGVPDARWQVAIGPVADALVLAGHWNDIVVVGANASPAGSGERLFCELLLSGVACMAVPEGCITPGRVMRAVVAWNESAASARAVHAALPLLRHAESVLLLQSPPDPARSRPAGALSHLRAHGVSVTAVDTVAETGERAGEQILAQAAEHRADLLVMGGSGRRRLGERRLGPTTGAVLAQSRMPVLLRQ